ncbi:MAG TPA: HD domain-containing phosphohydrolase, partial [Acidimicrobiia bacterium]|nr:HD domain-containing phosphohydrolase [Acidimicrobiia bacterium]
MKFWGTASDAVSATRDQERGDAWTPRPLWARVVCVFAALAPVALGAFAAIELSRRLPRTSSPIATGLRIFFVVVVSTAVVFAVDRAARRLLPLAALYRLSLVFPDHAPSRFRTALKAGSSRRVERLVEETRRHGLPHDPGEAARRVVELITAIGDHDRRTRGHSERVRLYADLIGEELHLSKDERQKLQWAALLHDLGKLAVPAEILNKKGAPDDEEWRVLRTHPAAGEQLIAPLRPFLGSWADAIGSHHEWWNGAGYPRQLRGDEISRSAAIVAVADAYEVMTAVRSYKKAMPASAARGELAHGAGKQFSPEVVRAFLCVSLGKLRWVAGPAASLAQIPYIGGAVRVPAAVSTSIQGATSVASAAAPSFATLMVATTAVASSMAASPPPPKAQAATTYAFAEARSGTGGKSSPTSTTIPPRAAGVATTRSTSAAKNKHSRATTSTSVAKPAAPNHTENPPSNTDTGGGGHPPDTAPPTTDTTVPPVPPEPVT